MGEEIYGKTCLCELFSGSLCINRENELYTLKKSRRFYENHQLSSPRRVWRYRYSGYQRYPSIPECFRFCGVKSIDHLYGSNSPVIILSHSSNPRNTAAIRNGSGLFLSFSPFSRNMSPCPPSTPCPLRNYGLTQTKTVPAHVLPVFCKNSDRSNRHL
jgi:hypothetical protein